MYYYAYIDTNTGFCYDVLEFEEPTNEPMYIALTGLQNPSYAAYAKIYAVRKTYENGAWRDTTVEEAENMYSTTMGERITVETEWLDVILNNKANTNHIHSEYASTANATQTSSGLMSASDKSKLDEMVLATVSEVETYLTI